MSRTFAQCFCVCICLLMNVPPQCLAADAIHLGARRELFVDDYLIERMEGVNLELQHPIEREVVFVHDVPWEGNTSTYHTVFRDGDKFRMYYRGSHYDEHTRKELGHEVVCYAESRDGIHWQRPELGLVEFGGTKRNNIVLSGPGSHDFAPFRDTNPSCRSDERYKALGRDAGGLITFQSADGIHWSRRSPQPVITEGAFDSLNIAFWDPFRSHYVDFHRDFRDGFRDIKTCTSSDFDTWTDPDWLRYSGAPPQHLYTNAIVAYERAPHLFLGFPMRLVPGRNPEQHVHDGVSDAVFMTSRDGQTFHRWNEAFIRPGQQRNRWVNRNNLPAWGLVITDPATPDSPPEISLYATESYYRGAGTRLRRYTLRLDGFVSVSAPPEGGEFVTKPLSIPTADSPVRLVLNFATSAVGSVRCEVQDGEGLPVSGFTLAECSELFGDRVDQPVAWSANSTLASLSGKVVRLRFVMRDADIYALSFARQTADAKQ